MAVTAVLTCMRQDVLHVVFLQMPQCIHAKPTILTSALHLVTCVLLKQLFEVNDIHSVTLVLLGWFLQTHFVSKVMPMDKFASVCFKTPIGYARMMSHECN